MKPGYHLQIAVVGTMIGVGIYALLLVPAYLACRAEGSGFWTCAHWLIR